MRATHASCGEMHSGSEGAERKECCIDQASRPELAFDSFLNLLEQVLGANANCVANLEELK